MICLCGDNVAPARATLGYKTCLPCGEQVARQARKGWCVAPLNKSNYILVTDPSLLKGLNPKRVEGKVNWELLFVLAATAAFWFCVVFIFNIDTGSI